MPVTRTVVGRASLNSVPVCTCTVVRWVKTGWASGDRFLVEPWPVAASSTSAGIPIAQSLSQYWKHWTNVTPFMPPMAMLALTTTPRATTPTQYGVPSTSCRVMPAPFIWGSR